MGDGYIVVVAFVHLASLVSLFVADFPFWSNDIFACIMSLFLLLLLVRLLIIWQSWLHLIVSLLLLFCIFHVSHVCDQLIDLRSVFLSSSSFFFFLCSVLVSFCFVAFFSICQNWLNVFLEFLFLLLLLLLSVFLPGFVSKLASCWVVPWGSCIVCSSAFGCDWSCTFSFCKIGFSGLLQKKRETGSLFGRIELRRWWWRLELLIPSLELGNHVPYTSSSCKSFTIPTLLLKNRPWVLDRFCSFDRVQELELRHDFAWRKKTKHIMVCWNNPCSWISSWSVAVDHVVREHLMVSSPAPSWSSELRRRIHDTRSSCSNVRLLDICKFFTQPWGSAIV